MASGAPNKKVIGRAAAILTTGEVAGASFDLNESHDAIVSVYLTFTLGSLTNVIVRFYGSSDNSTFDPLAGPTGAVITETITASATRRYLLPMMKGIKWFRATVQGTGTVTSSSCAFDYVYWRRGTQT